MKKAQKPTTKATKTTRLAQFLVVLALTTGLANTQTHTIKGIIQFNDLAATLPKYMKYTKNDTGVLKKAYMSYVFDTSTGNLGFKLIFSITRHLFSPMAVISVNRINTNQPSGDLICRYYNMSAVNFNYWYKFSVVPHTIPDSQTMFAMGDPQFQFKKLADILTYGFYIGGGSNVNTTKEYAVEVGPGSNCTDISNNFNSNIGVIWLTLLILPANIALAAVLFVKVAFKDIPFFSLAMSAIANLPLFLAAYSRGGLISAHSGYWQLYLWAIPTVGYLGFIAFHVGELINSKYNKVVLYTATGYLAALLLLFFIFTQAVPYILVMVPVNLAIEGIYHKKPLFGMGLINGMITCQLLVYFYVFYYPYNSAVIPIDDPVNVYLLIVLYLGAYAGAFIFYFKKKGQLAEDPEGDAHKKSEAEDGEEIKVGEQELKDGAYVKAGVTEVEVEAEVEEEKEIDGGIPMSPSIAGTDTVE